MVVLGIDPGVNNLGWCVTSSNGSIIEWGLLTETLTDLKKPDYIRIFKKRIKPLIRTLNSYTVDNDHKPDLIMERYMPRGMRKGNQTERINILIGYLLGKVKYSDVFMVPASSWKNHREKNYMTVDNNTIPDHMVDSYTMTLYLLERIKGRISVREVIQKMKKVDRTDYGWKFKRRIWVHE